MELITGYNQSNCEEKGSVVLIYVLCMMSVVTDYGFADVISGREQLYISVVVSATVALNQSMNSGRSKMFCSKCGLLTKLKFAKQDKRYIAYVGLCWNQKKYSVNTGSY